MAENELYMSLRIIIVEDEAVLAETAKSILQSLGYTIVGMALRVEKAIQLFDTVEFDLALLDINLGKGAEGIQLAEYLNEKHHKPFMFVTSYADPGTIEKAKHTRPSAYIMKPFKKEDFYAAIEIAMMKQQPEEEQVIVIKEGYTQIKVNVADILWLKSDNAYVEVITSGKRYLQRISLESILEQLPADMFIRTHRSYAVNVKKIKGIKGQVVLVEGESIPLSRKHREAVQATFTS